MNQTRTNGKKLILGLILACFGQNLVPKSFFPGFNFYLMLYIFASYHCIHFQGKPVKQIWENGQKPSFRTNFDPNFPCPPQNFFFFWSFASAKCYALLQAVIVCNFKENCKTKIEKMAKKKTSFGTDFGSFGSNLGPQIFFSWILPALDITHYCKLSLYAISRKTNEANLRKWPKLLFQVRFWPKFVLPSQTNKLFGVLYLEDVMHCYKLSSYATSRETNESNLRKWQKP